MYVKRRLPCFTQNYIEKKKLESERESLIFNIYIQPHYSKFENTYLKLIKSNISGLIRPVYLFSLGTNAPQLFILCGTKIFLGFFSRREAVS